MKIQLPDVRGCISMNELEDISKMLTGVHFAAGSEFYLDDICWDADPNRPTFVALYVFEPSGNPLNCVKSFNLKYHSATSLFLSCLRLMFPEIGANRICALANKLLSNK